MLAQSLGLIATGALGASAFMIPAGIVQAQDTSNVQVFDPKNQLYRLPCPGCAFATAAVSEKDFLETEEKDFFIQGGANELLLNFTVTDEQTLEVNGQTIYPRFTSNRKVERHIVQVPASASLADIEAGNARQAVLEITGDGTFWNEEEAITDAGDMLIPMSYWVFQLENVDMELSQVYIEMLRTAEGELLITSIDEHGSLRRPKQQSQPISPEGMQHIKDGKHALGQAVDAAHCGSLPEVLCRVKNMVEAKINALKGPHPPKRLGCTGKPHFANGVLPTHRRPGFRLVDMPKEGEESVPSFHGMRPHHHQPNGHPHHGFHGRHHHHRHSFFHAFMRGLHLIVIPTLIGVACGMLVSVVGLVVGHFISFVWIRFVRGGRQGYQSVSLDDNAAVAAAEDEKIVYEVDAAQEEALPVYEDAPAYEADVKTEQ